MKRILCCFGTRPEFIKMYPLVCELKKDFCVDSVNTGQHKELLEPLLKAFEFSSTYSLDTLEKGQSLNKLSSKILILVDEIVKQYDLVIVQGDTTTASCVALAAFNNNVKVAHVEAGLRSNNKQNPFPEEVNRRIISQISDFNFCPTKSDYDNIKDSLTNKNYVVGNTVVDMLNIAKSKPSNILETLNLNSSEYVLVTCHRRENHESIDIILNALDEISNKYKLVIPVHMNPNVRNKFFEKFSSNSNVVLCESFEYIDMVKIIENCKFIISDSGGIQEEAPTFNKFVYVLRTHTERNESVVCGYSKLVGNDYDTIVNSVSNYVDVNDMKNPYGDGTTSKQIREILKNEL